MFRIKICGVTSQKDALAVADAGADAIGLNFFEPSPRSVSVAKAAEIADSVRGQLSTVGVFVNHSAEQIRTTAESLGLDYVQLHGDEPFSLVEELSGLRIIRAFRCSQGGLAPVREFVDRATKMGIELSGVLIDAHQPGLYGGTGQTANWHTVRGAREQLAGIPTVLAGGLTPANVGKAISVVRPEAVDTASGVELSPGVKSRELIAVFVAAAREAFPGSPAR